MRSFELGSLKLSDESKPFLIAEIGHNHQGSVETALELIRAAAMAGVSAVKFQKRSNKDLFTKKAYNSPYNSENAFGSTYGLHREALELDRKSYELCALEASNHNVIFFSTAFDFPSVDFLMDLNVPLFKIASGDLTNHPLLRYVARTGKPMIVSTGGVSVEHVVSAVDVLREEKANFAILQCTAGYPPKYEELNLRVIETYRKMFPEVVIGYSGHDNGIAMPLAAYVLGARIIEKHFTLDRTMKGTDHAFSLEPQGMRKLVRDLDRTHRALGDGKKIKYDSEVAPMIKMGKMIVAKDKIPRGSRLELKDLEFKSPAEGLPPSQLLEVVGMYTRFDIQKEEPILLDLLTKEYVD